MAGRMRLCETNAALHFRCINNSNNKQVHSLHRHRQSAALVVCSASGSSSSSSSKEEKKKKREWNPDPSVDTRIHWSSPDEGWVGGSYDAPPPPSIDGASLSSGTASVLDNLLTNLVAQAQDTHYEFLGVPPNADAEQVKTAYRKLSKLYHPDTTSLPLDLAAQKFIRLQKAYVILSSMEERRFYDWSLAQEVSRQQGGRFIWPYEADRTQRGPGSELESETQVEDESAGGPYYELSGQIWTAVAFDALALLVSIICIVYVYVFRH